MFIKKNYYKLRECTSNVYLFFHIKILVLEQSNTICEIALKKRRPKDLHFKEYIKLDRDKSTFKSHRDFSSERDIL